MPHKNYPYYFTKRLIAQDSLSYVVMNLIGALLAGLASWMINYTPFIILEAVWVLVSMMSLVSIMRRPSIK